MINQYKEMMAKVEAPEALKEKTLAAMRAARSGQASAVPLYRRPAMVFAVAAAVIVLAVIPIYQNRAGDSIIKTELGEQHIAHVDLRDGYLEFADSGQMEEPNLNLGLINPLQKKWTVQEYEEYLKRDPQLDYIPAGFDLAGSEIRAKYLADGQIESVSGTFQYENSDNANIKWIVSDEAIIPPLTIDPEIRSEVNGVEIYAAHKNSKAMYCVLFEQYGQYHMLSAQYLTQEEFIKVLYNLIN